MTIVRGGGGIQWKKIMEWRTPEKITIEVVEVIGRITMDVMVVTREGGGITGEDGESPSECRGRRTHNNLTSTQDEYLERE